MEDWCLSQKIIHWPDWNGPRFTPSLCKLSVRSENLVLQWMLYTDLAITATFACPGWLLCMWHLENCRQPVTLSPDQSSYRSFGSTAPQWPYWCRLNRLNYEKGLSLLLHLKLFPGVQNSKFSFHVTPLYVAANEISRLEALCLSQQGKMFLEQGHFENRSYSNKKPLRNREINTCDIGAGWQSFTVLFQQNRQGQVHRRFTVENYLDRQTEAIQN